MPVIALRLALTVTLSLIPIAVGAAGTPEQKCQEAKNKAAGKHADCRQKAEAKLATSGDVTKHTTALGKCETKFTTAWQKAIAKATNAGATCLDDPLTTNDFQTVIDAHTDNIATALGGGGLVDCPAELATVNAGTAVAADVLAGMTFSSGAGLGLTGSMPDNGAVNITPGMTPQAIPAGYHNGAGTVAGDADLIPDNIKTGVNLFGVTGSFGAVLRTGQTTSYGPGSDGDLQKGAARSYTDNGDGTITDNATGLMWEKKGDDGSVHDWNNQYTWGMASPPYTMNGTMVTTFLATLNGGGGFAGYTDWRIPNRFELESLINLGIVTPAVSAEFNSGCVPGCSVTTCSCMPPSTWSSTTHASPDAAWLVNFQASGTTSQGNKGGSLWVRAVRGGS